MITRSFDPSVLNDVANHPAVLPWITIPGIDHLDLTEAVLDPKNYLLQGTDGCFFLHPVGESRYEIHTQFYPHAKLRQTIADGFDCIRFMFEESDCVEIVTRVPVHNKAADWFTRRMGFKFNFLVPSCWPTPSGLVDLKFYRLVKCH